MKNTRNEAIRLVNHFTMNGFIKDETTSDQMVAFAKFAAIQHLTEITSPNMDLEVIVETMAIISEISKLDISYPHDWALYTKTNHGRRGSDRQDPRDCNW